eukprot:TRINITY_DN6579_c0_g1_i2.p1 TRINITY_DN6579_c0_g1~~TRINITY_DN6579_c0_g1_i2.p1  ORF type:complete len:279 (-),score=44.14 TRINITY_DN6579_c0_g1_i2:105-941(-)
MSLSTLSLSRVGSTLATRALSVVARAVSGARPEWGVAHTPMHSQATAMLTNTTTSVRTPGRTHPLNNVYTHTRARITTATEPVLDHIVKLDLLQQEPADKVTKIWVDYHKQQVNCISGVLPESTYALLLERFTKCPQFIFPVTRGTTLNKDGSEPQPPAHEGEEGPALVMNVFMQVQAHPHNLRIMLTDATLVKENPAQAPVYLYMDYFTELMQDKGIVLMKGNLTPNSELTVLDAQMIANQIQIFYLAQDKYNLVHKFNHDPSNFDYAELVKSMDTV